MRLLAVPALGLLGCAAHVPHPAPAATVPPLEQPHVMTTLLPEPGVDEAIMRASGGKRLCSLPCTLPIPYAVGYYVDVTKDGSTRRVNVPADLGPDHSGVTAVVLRKEGHPGAAKALLIGGTVMTLFGAAALALCSAKSSSDPGAGGDFLCLPGAVSLGVGMLLLVPGAIFAATSREPGLDVVSRRASE